MARHVAHFAVKPRAQPLEKMGFIGGQIDGGDAQSGKAQLRRPSS